MRKLLILLALVLLSLTATGRPALAQAETWECDYDYTIEDGGFVAVADFGTWNEGTGWEHVDAVLDSEPDVALRMVYIELSFPSTTITEASVTFDYTEGTFNGENPAWLIFADGPTLLNSADPDTISSGDDQTFTYTGSDETTLIGFEVIASFDIEEPLTSYDGAVTVTSAHLEGEGASPCEPVAFVKPIKPSDVDEEWNTIETYAAGIGPTQKTMFQYSDASGAKVHSAASGTITNIHKVQLGDCVSYLLAPGTGLTSSAAICSLSVHGYVFFLPGTYVNTPVEVVTLETDSGFRIIYFVKNSTNYVQEGMHVQADCWLGETFHLETITLSVGLGPFGAGADTTPGSGGAVIFSLQEDAVAIDGPDLFSIEATGNAPCNQPEGYEQCLGDAPLNIPGEWTAGGATWDEPGITLQPGGYVAQTMNLLESFEPTMKVRAQGIGGSSTFRMQLGTTIQNETVTPADAEYVIPPGPHEGDLAGLYTVKVTNTGSASIKLTYICVQNTTDGEDPLDPPPEGPPDTPNDTDNVCIFDNNSFTDGTTGWSVTSTDSGPGELRVQDGGTWSQNVSVPADTYTLTIVASVWSYLAFTPDDTESDDVTIEWDFPADTTYDGSQSKTYGQFAENGNLVVYQIEVVVGADATDDFTMRLSLESVPAGVRGIAIRSVCLGDPDAGGGGDGEGTGPGEDGPFEVSCTSSTSPTGNGFGSWVGWLWGKFRSFFSCELMILLNNMYTLMQKSYTLFGWSIRYSQAVTVGSFQWVSVQFLPWLGGHLSNIALGQVTTIQTAEQCGNVFCLLQGLSSDIFSTFNGVFNIISQLVDANSPFWDIVRDVVNDGFDLLSTIFEGVITILNRILDFLINIISQVVGLLGTIIIGIVGFIIALIGKAYELFSIVIQIITALINGWTTATPISSGLLTSCDLDQMQPHCMIYYIAERTVLTEMGQHYVVVASAFLMVAFMMWAYRKIVRAIEWLGVLS